MNADKIAQLPDLWRRIEQSDEPQTEFDKGYEQASRECAEAIEAALAEHDAQPAQAAQPWTEAEKSHMKAAAELVAEREALAQPVGVPDEWVMVPRKWTHEQYEIFNRSAYIGMGESCCGDSYPKMDYQKGFDALVASFAAPRPPAQPSADAGDVAKLAQAVAEWAGDADTEIAQHDLLRLVELGFLEVDEFFVTKKGNEALNAARAAEGGE